MSLGCPLARAAAFVTRAAVRYVHRRKRGKRLGLCGISPSMISSSDPKRGVVHLVGAGPGDPGLITVRGARLLELADVVVYDYLSNPKLLSYCPQAESIYVGKKAAAH